MWVIIEESVEILADKVTILAYEKNKECKAAQEVEIKKDAGTRGTRKITEDFIYFNSRSQRLCIEQRHG